MSNASTVPDRLTDWFDHNARDLPWRNPPGKSRDPYTALVAEFMLQQTQVSRVLERFGPFMSRFPSPESLARASQDDVLAAWSGLGYYRRAKMLWQAAKVIRDEFSGRVPTDTSSLRRLPGVGRYTAGAIASIVGGHPEPIVDGNVARVLARLDGVEGPPDMDRAWVRSGELVAQARRPGVFNEALMELGAVICTPRNPDCASCPLASACRARALDRADAIPAPKASVDRKPLFATSGIAVDSRGRILVEQRPQAGLWGGLWQPPTIESDRGHKRPATLARSISADSASLVSSFEFLTTHRRVIFRVYRVHAARAGHGRQWVSRKELSRRALSNAHRQVLVRAGVELPEAVSS